MMLSMKTKAPIDKRHGSTSNSFLAKFGDQISGFLQGFDRLRLRGTLRQLYCPTVMEAYLCAQDLKYRDFGKMAERSTQKLKAAAEGLAQRSLRPVVYLSSSGVRKEELAREIAQRDGVEEGLIALFKAVEPCQAYALRRKREETGFEFRLEIRKCLHFYFYFEHRRFGLMSVRLQSWLPFQVDVWVNGRHWLGRQLDEAGVAYRKCENALLWVEDAERAQQLLDEQSKINWRSELNELLQQTHPTAAEICRPLNLEYYWSVSESEYASDVLFKKPETLARIYPGLVHHAVRSFGSDGCDALFRTPCQDHERPSAQPFQRRDHQRSQAAARGGAGQTPGGGNTIKIYDKQGSVLRVETTINDPLDFKAYRKAENQPQSQKAWRVLRRNVADLPRRAQVSKAANRRYLEALGAVSGTVPLFEWAQEVCCPVRRAGRRYRALNPLTAADGALLEAVNRGEFTVNGFRNRDIRALLHPGNLCGQIKRKRTSAITRKLLLLRAHGLIAKVSHTLAA